MNSNQNHHPLEIFRCPLTGANLVEATVDELAAFNRSRTSAPAHRLGDGTVIPPTWPAAWKTSNDAPQPCHWYPVLDGIPLLVSDAAVVY